MDETLTGKKVSKGSGFTLMELVMVILLLAILGAVAIPNFIDFRTDAKDSATKAALGSLRSSLAIATAAIQLKEESGVAKYPTYAEMAANAFDGSHTNLNGTAIMDNANGIPKNPWTPSAVTATDHNKVFDCSAKSKGGLLAAPDDDRGWCYNPTTGSIWANTDKNGLGAGKTENNF